jgi:hypothetical protein
VGTDAILDLRHPEFGGILLKQCMLALFRAQKTIKAKQRTSILSLSPSFRDFVIFSFHATLTTPAHEQLFNFIQMHEKIIKIYQSNYLALKYQAHALSFFSLVSSFH